MQSSALALLLAIAVPVGTAPASSSPSPSPSGSPRPPLKTIVTVKSSPYCTALAEHFNSALVPMLANDRVFTAVSPQLDDMNDMFKHPDYIRTFVTLRTKLIKESGDLMNSLRPIQQQIDQLRQSATLSSDPAEQKQMRDAATKLQDAYTHQFQLSNDLAALAQSMMEYDIFKGDHPLSGWSLYDNTLPPDEKNIKIYLKFDNQRKGIDDGESSAVDIAYSIAENNCAKQ